MGISSCHLWFQQEGSLTLLGTPMSNLQTEIDIQHLLAVNSNWLLGTQQKCKLLNVLYRVMLLVINNITSFIYWIFKIYVYLKNSTYYYILIYY